MTINGKTKLYGIIGNPVSHSMSPAMHNAAFAAMDMNVAYLPMQVEDIEKGIIGLQALGFTGISVTVPHKETVMPHVDEIDPVAKKIGAVNTLLFRENNEGKLISRGFNTDWLGANTALAEKIKLQNSRVLVVGAGGAAKAVGFGLVEAGAEVYISNRTREKGKALAHWLGCEFLSSEDITDFTADVLINTTSVGMEPNIDASIVPASSLSQFKVVMDIVYAPLQTKLLQEANEAGCETIDGLAMLLYQGAAQFKIWTGRIPPLPVMRSALEEELRNRTKSS